MPCKLMVRLIAILLFIFTWVSIASASDDQIDLGYSPSQLHKEMAQAKAGALARQFEAEKSLTPEIAAAVDEYDVFYYDIDWRPSLTDTMLYGAVTMFARVTAPSINSVILFLSDSCDVDSVYNASGRRPTSHSAGMVTVYLERSYTMNEEFNFTVVYSGRPILYSETHSTDGLILFTYAGATVLSNLSQPYGARNFWPCKDIVGDKCDSIDVHLTVENGLTGVSNGLLISDLDNGDGTHTSHWRHRYPLPSYAVCLSVSEYDLWTDYYVYSPTDSMPVENYVYPWEYDTTHASYGRMPEAIGIFADMFVEYPFIREKYGNTQVIFGSMEHQTNTFMSSIISNFQGLINTLVHELAHSWWGNLVTCRDWHNIWLNEGFASYCEALYHEQIEGEAYMHAYMADMEYLDGGTLYVYDVADFSSIFSWRSYDKGAWVLHMLRAAVGDSAFFEAMRQYADLYAYGSVDSDDFQAVMEDVSGTDLDYFFQEWLYGEYYPIYRYSYFIEDNDLGGSNIFVHIRQKQTTEPQVFTMPISLHLQTDTGAAPVRVFNERREQDFIITTDYPVDYLDFDSDHWILSRSMWEGYGFHIINETLSPAAQAQAYLDSVCTRGGSGICSFELLSGEMPPGWNLDPSSGIISGYSTAEGAFAFEIKAVDLVYPQEYYDSVMYTVVMGEPDPRPGDANADGGVNVGDAVYAINYVFSGGPPPMFLNWADANADCDVNVGDAVYLINYVFKSGPEPLMGCVE